MLRGTVDTRADVSNPGVSGGCGGDDGFQRTNPEDRLDTSGGTASYESVALIIPVRCARAGGRFHVLLC